MWGGAPAGGGGWGGGAPGGWGGAPPGTGGWGGPPPGTGGGGWGGAPPGTVGGGWGGAPGATTTTTVTTTVKPPPTGFAGNWYSGYYNQANPTQLYEIMAWFQSIDTDRSGSITPNEIAGVTFGGYPLGMDTATRLTRVFDKDKSNTIDFHEYAAMHGFLSKLQQAFFAGDKDRSGRLDAREIHGALSVAGLTCAMPGVSSLMRKFDRTGYGITFPDFLSLAATIAQAKSLMQWQGRGGSLTLNFDQLVQLVGDMS